MTQQKCEDRIDREWQERREELRQLLAAYPDEAADDLGSLDEFFYDVSYWPADGDCEAYVQCLMSGGGPSDMLRFRADGRVLYVFQDWFDSAERDVTAEDCVRELGVWLSGRGSLDRLG